MTITLLEFINNLETNFQDLNIDTIAIDGNPILYNITDIHVKRNQTGYTLDFQPVNYDEPPETYKYNFETLKDLYSSDSYEMYIDDLDRNDYSGTRPDPENQTHQDTIDDWKAYLESIKSDLSELNYSNIMVEILECEVYHHNNGSINDQMGV